MPFRCAECGRKSLFSKGTGLCDTCRGTNDLASDYLPILPDSGKCHCGAVATRRVLGKMYCTTHKDDAFADSAKLSNKAAGHPKAYEALALKACARNTKP